MLIGVYVGLVVQPRIAAAWVSAPPRILLTNNRILCLASLQGHGRAWAGACGEQGLSATHHDDLLFAGAGRGRRMRFQRAWSGGLDQPGA